MINQTFINGWRESNWRQNICPKDILENGKVSLCSDRKKHSYFHIALLSYFRSDILSSFYS